MGVAVIVGSSFGAAQIAGEQLLPQVVETPYGAATLHRWPRREGCYALFRHGVPHRCLPHQIPYRANAAALREVGCEAVLATTSVSLLDPALPLFTPLPVGDLLMLDNRLPDGTTCTMFPEPEAEQGHLVVDEGLFSAALDQQVATLAAEVGWQVGAPVVFGYSGGPRTKTAAENAFWRSTGAQVNSMTLAPEVVLLNELQIAVSGLAVGHKPAGARTDGLTDAALAASLEQSRTALEALVGRFLDAATTVPFENRIYRFDS